MLHLRVHAGPHARRCCPVSVELDLEPDARVTLYQEPGHRPRYAQLEPTATGSRLTWMVTRLAAGEVQDYQLVRTPRRRRPAPRVRWRELATGRFQALLEGQPVAGWNLAATFPCLDALNISAEAVQSLLTRLWQAAELWPIPHVRSVLAHADRPLPGPVFGRLTYCCHWLGPVEQRLAEELIRATVFAMPAHLRLIDLELTLQARTGAVRFSSPSPGLIRFELAKALTASRAIAAASGARTALELAKAPAPWCLVDGPSAGLGLFACPENPGSGCQWRLEPDGVLHADPLCSFERFAALLPEVRPQLAAGEALTFRFRLCVHAGKHRVAAIRQHYADYAFPPRVEIV